MSITRLSAVLLAALFVSINAELIAGDTRATLFPRPAELAPATLFWTRVYTNLDSASGIIHDSHKLDVV